jgi:uncharacterized protein (DUF1778 family)
MRRDFDITISLGDLTARTGETQVIYRVSGEDKVDLDEAASRLNMSTSQFLRMVTVQAARKVLAELI